MLSIVQDLFQLHEVQIDPLNFLAVECLQLSFPVIDNTELVMMELGELDKWSLVFIDRVFHFFILLIRFCFR